MVFGIESTMAAVTTDAVRGVTDRFRSLPVASSAVVAGRAVADVLNSALGPVALMACGLIVGWSWNAGAGNVLLAVALLLWLRFATGVGIYLGLLARNPQAVVAMQIPSSGHSASCPARSCRGTRCPHDSARSRSGIPPRPRSGRSGNPNWAGNSRVAEHPDLMAVVCALVLVAIFLPPSARRHRGLAD